VPFRSIASTGASYSFNYSDVTKPTVPDSPFSWGAQPLFKVTYSPAPHCREQGIVLDLSFSHWIPLRVSQTMMGSSFDAAAYVLESESKFTVMSSDDEGKARALGLDCEVLDCEEEPLESQP
jgi:hypothetical protein